MREEKEAERMQTCVHLNPLNLKVTGSKLHHKECCSREEENSYLFIPWTRTCNSPRSASANNGYWMQINSSGAARKRKEMKRMRKNVPKRQFSQRVVESLKQHGIQALLAIGGFEAYDCGIANDRSN